ncbi:MAG: helix-turn-helix domain-containing protein [Ruminococcus sp.]|nr:helix-turn-helix domain-containing protein [Ruminococcus sp.]
MKPKELQQKLGITAERIKLFKREGIFAPENQPVGNRSTNYTEADYNNLKFIIVLTKSGLTCSDIRKLQNGECTLEEAIITRRLYIEDDMARKRNSLTLLAEILDDNEAFEDFHIDHYWDIISKRERLRVKSSLMLWICMTISLFHLSELFVALTVEKNLKLIWKTTRLVRIAMIEIMKWDRILPMNLIAKTT